MTMTTNGSTEPETPAQAAPQKTRNPPRKLTMTDKIREAREINVNKVRRLTARADQLRDQLAATVRDLNDARAEVERADAVLPQVDDAGRIASPGVNERIAQLAGAEQLEADRMPAVNGAAAG